MLTIAIDTMGGDLGHSAVVEGAVQAIKEFPDINLVLIGPDEVIRAELDKYGKHPNISILHAPDVIEPSEVPTTAIRQKKESSIVVGLKYIKEGNAQGFVSAGSTGALLTGATLILKRQQGIERPALATLIPTHVGHSLLIDCGANVDAKPAYFLQFGQLGADYMKKCMNVKNPKVALVNIGAEKEKGSVAVKEAYNLLENSQLNFIGNIEAREIPKGEVDVIVCDGFVGNVLLKFMEGFAKTMMAMLKEELLSGTMSKLGALMAKGAFANLKKRFDYREVGGAPFLGLTSLVVKAHGSSDALAIKSAIRQAVIYARTNE